MKVLARTLLAAAVVLGMVPGMAPGAGTGAVVYLMTPPPDSIRDKQTPPLSQWEQFAAFDTVAQCEAGHTQLFDRRMTDLGKTPTGIGQTRDGKISGWSSLYEAAFKAAWAASAGRCVSSDDPRLRP